MRCWFVTFSLSTTLLNCVLAFPDGDLDNDEENAKRDEKLTGYKLNDDYSSGDQARNPITLLGEVDNDETFSEKRPLVAGDTFTPQDMLPIAEKLIGKVEEPGYGKGFVSSTKGPQELADKLYEAFFYSTKRIITLKDFDISGLDALQALALGGEAPDNTLTTEEVTEPTKKIYLRGQIVNIKNLRPKKSHYKLVTKTVPKEITTKTVTKGKRRGIPLAKKLPPKRHLVVNEHLNQKRGRVQKINGKNNKKEIKQTQNTARNNMKKRKPQMRNSPKPERKTPKCRWNYVCSNPGDLDTCHVQTSCGNDNSQIFDYTKRDEDTKAIKEFRRMIGITVVDEEVEKILEARSVKLRPVNLEAINRVESLSEFFNNILVRENMDSTTPIEGD